MTVFPPPSSRTASHGGVSTRHPDGPGPALVAVAHGSREPAALTTVRALLDRVRELRPGVPVHLGHIELNEPLLADTLAALPPGPAILVPLLLSRGHHITHDIPYEAAAAPHLDARVAAPLGPHPLLAEVLHDRLIEAGWAAGAPSATRHSSTVPTVPIAPGIDAPLRRAPRPHDRAVVLAAAGSRDPNAAVDARRTAALLARRLGVPVVTAYASAAEPTVPQALRMLALGGWRQTAVASYFTAPGRFAMQCAAASAGPAAAPLGAHPALARLLWHRYDEALTLPPSQRARPRPRPRRLTPA
ncbi:sirohydrochlorin chelatase [Streptomyces odontomachi]|uniref:sirohydrochlorin chelatase n=1 Tax=Streptomyces odontomachi TaxID=2944940 RepID=UPI002108CE29|nr:CbiX/SirB N-terminal domain-containing protein [Streptomyces sp. ODS25]